MINEAQKRCLPLIGHNCTYDLIYFYNQFVGPLPDTYKGFAQKWHDIFPHSYDTKNLATKADYFNRTVLGNLYEKVKADKRLAGILGFEFDSENGFTNYMGAGLLEHYHEAAYDAYMTGVVFGKILKYRQVEDAYQL